jgi:hypothetical protein
MNGWPGHRIRILLLALVLAFEMSLTVVQGSLMAAEMAVAADGAHHAPGHCDGCGGDDHKNIDASVCLTLCGFAAQSILPGEPVALLPASRASFQVARLVLGGRSHSPDHGPPKILTLG